MEDKTDNRKIKKGFFSRMIEKFDKKMEEKAKSSPCCKGENKTGEKSCCS